MMRLSGADQGRVQAEVANLSAAERRESLQGGHELLAVLSHNFRQTGLDETEERLAALTIEMICRAECIENGRGPWYRLRRRLALVTQYFHP
jgi:hypothetical protein